MRFRQRQPLLARRVIPRTISTPSMIAMPNSAAKPTPVETLTFIPRT